MSGPTPCWSTKQTCIKNIVITAPLLLSTILDLSVWNSLEVIYGTHLKLYIFSINTQVIIQNRALSLARYLGLSADNHLDGQNGCQ